MSVPDYNLNPIDFDPFAGPEIVKAVPAIEPQIEIWTSYLIGGEDANRSYNESISLRLHGSLNNQAMEKSLQDIVIRHDALRSGFSADGKQLCIFKAKTPEFSYEDLSSKDSERQQQFIDEFSQQNALTPFDLLNGPLFRVALFKLSDKQHYLTLSAHHIICDGWSLGVIMQDLSALYSAYAKGEAPNLPEAPSFSNYALEQTEFSGSKEYKETVKYWIDQYKGEIPILDIPTDFPRPAFRTYKSKRDDYSINSDLVSSIKSIGAKAGCSFVTTLLVAYEVFLHRLSGQDDIVLGVPAAGQAITGNTNLVGHCVNLLPLRSHHNGESSFIDFLKKRRLDILDAYEHQQFTFGTLLKKLNVPRDASRIPLVPIMFNIDIGLIEGVDFEDLTYELISNKREFENFEIFLNATGSGNDLMFEWSYNTQLFKPETIKRMMADFEYLLYTIVQDPELKIKDIRQADFHDLENKLAKWNETFAAYPQGMALHDIISQRASENPDRIILRYNNENFSYRNLNESANQLAGLLIDNNINIGDTIGLAVDRSPRMVIALLAIMKCGAAYVPIDPTYPQLRIEYMLDDSGAKILLTSKIYKGQFNGNAKEILIEDAWDMLSDYPKEDIQVKVSGDDLVYIMYTSGSSGKPKGTLIEHHSLVNFLYSMQKVPGINPDDILLAVTTISFDIAGLELYLPLISGALLLIADTDTAKDGRSLVDLMVSEKISIMQATPSTWRMMLDTGWVPPVGLKILCGGEALPKDLANTIIASKYRQFWNMYGPTETTIWSTVKQIISIKESITIGRPIDNTQIYVLDQYLKLLPQGSTGEIYIAGDGLARGYLNKPELTSGAFLDNPFSAEKGKKMYRTGDLGRFMPNGEIQYLGRIDNQVKIRGHRIELGSIEDCLNVQKGISEAVVIVREDRPNDQRLVAYIVPEKQIGTEEAVIQITSWKQELKKLLPNHMIPSDFVLLKQFPLTPNGKIDKNSLPKPDLILNTDKGFIKPRTEIESLIAGIWSEALGLESVGVYDDFFELGGHSLIAVQVMTRLEKETGHRLPLATLFNHSTIEELAFMLETDSKSITWDSLVPIKPHGTKMPLYIVHGAGLNVLIFNTLAKNTDDDQPVYGLQAQGLNGVDDPLEKIEDMAAHYISEILNQNPTGPYALAGFSFGGIIAFEMAKQLKTMGKEVKMLAMFDTYAYQSDKFKSWNTRLYNHTRYFINQLFFSFVLLKEDPKRAIEYKAEAVKRRFVELYWRLKYGKNQKQEGFFGYAHNVDEKNEEAWENYILTPYDGTVELFKAKKRTFYMDDFQYLGWKPFAKEVHMHEIPGEHNYIFAPPNDVEFARILQNCLNNAAKLLIMGTLYLIRNDITLSYLQLL